MTSDSNHGSKRFASLAWLTLILLSALAPLLIFGAVKTLQSTSNDPRQWLPRTFEETSKYDRFQEYFGSDEISIVSWPGCTLADERVLRLAQGLKKSPFFERVVTGPRVVRELLNSSIGINRHAAIQRLRGILVGPDGETTCLVLVTSAIGKADRTGAVREIERCAVSDCDLPISDLRLAGPTVDAAAIDTESRSLLFELAALSAFLSFIVATFRLRSFRLAIMVLVVAMYSTGLALGIVHLCGGKMNLLMTMLPPLVYVLSISAAVHLVNYYREAERDFPPAKALGIALAHGWLPCVLAAATTALGLASLLLSQIEPIRMFGLYSALGVLSSVIVLFLLLPAGLYLFHPGKAAAEGLGQASVCPDGRFVKWISRRYAVVTFGCLCLMAFCGWGLPHLKSTVKLQDRFLSGSDAITDYEWLEQHIGPMVPLEVILDFGTDCQKTVLERIQIVASVQKKIQTMKEPLATISAANLSPHYPRGGGVKQVVQRKLVNRRLEEGKKRLINSRFLAEQGNGQLWRITVRANAIGDLDYGQFADRLRDRVDPLLRENDVQATFTGVIPLIYKAQRQLLQDLVRSFLTAFGVIAIILLFVLRSLSATLLAMVPNLFPAVVVFGGMEWAQIPVQIGSVMTASAALGIAVDDTVHFLTWFRRGLAAGMPRVVALQEAFQQCAGAMAHTTVICSTGLLVFGMSSFVPVLHFVALMVLLLFSALLGDLVLLPAILAGPLGRCFEKGKIVTQHEVA